MTIKWLWKLQARVQNGEVLVSSYKSTPGFDEGEKCERYRKLRVYRRRDNQFPYGVNCEEYFDGLRYEDAELIFEGALEAENQRKFTYVDRNVEKGITYAYWMADAQGEPVGPVAVKIRDPELYWSHEMLRAKLTEMQERFPDQVKLESIGRTVKGCEIQAVRVGRAERCLALVGYIHAGESGAELIIPVLERLLNEKPEILNQIAVVAIPVVNLDEKERMAQGIPWYLRENANRVDLNRNFPTDWETVEYGYGMISSDSDSTCYRGPFAASEPETNAVIQFLLKHLPEVVYVFHWVASICGPCFLGPKCGSEDTEFVKACQRMVEHYGKGMMSDFDIKANLFLSTASGSLPTWCYRQLGIPAFDLELTSSESEANIWQACLKDATNLAMLQKYRNKHFAGLLATLEYLAQEL